jgi:uncharacterized protein (DUF736 family)
MNIGILTKQADGTLSGNLPSMNLHGVSFEKVAKTKDKSPDYRITIEGAELGAAWIEQKEDKTYLRGQIDSPLFPVPVYFAVFQSKTDANTYAVAWDRPKKKATKEEAPSDF